MEAIIHYLLKDTKVEGPKRRYCIWFQGCSKRCKGCFSKATWDFEGGYKIDCDKLLEDIDTILRQFDNEIGILAMNGKKERMITDEVQAINDDTCARASSWFENLSDSFDRVNSLFPELDLSFTFKYGGEKHEYVSASNSDGAI